MSFDATSRPTDFIHELIEDDLKKIKTTVG